MAGYRSLPLAPVSSTTMATTAVAAAAAPPTGVPTMYHHHQSMTAMSNNGIIYQSAVHASIHSLNTTTTTLQNQQRSTTHHHILATAAAAAVAATRQYTSSSSSSNSGGNINASNHLHQHHQQQLQLQQQQHQQQQHHHQHQHQHQHHQQQQQQQHILSAQQHHTHAALHQQTASSSHAHHSQLALHQNHHFFLSGSSMSAGVGQHHHHNHHHHHRQIFSQMQSAILPLNVNGEPIKLPDNLESLPRADSFPSQRHRWNTNEEIAAILISFDKHNEWQSKEVKTRPKSGSLLLYSRKKVRYRRDGYCWKKRKDGKTTREDHMKLKVQGTECIYGCYVHSAILPTFHRRCYWLLQNPDIVLVHYLNVPYPDDNKMAVIAPSITLWGDKKEWTKEELVSQLKPMLSSVTSDDDSDSGNDIEISAAETVESLVCQLMEKQRLSRQAALVKQLDCGCADATCVDGKSCSHPIMRRTGLLKSVSSEKRGGNYSDNYNQATSTTPNVVIGPKLYSRWPDRRQRDDNHHYQQQQQQQQQHHTHQQHTQEGAIKFQIIQPQHNEQQHHSHQHHHQQQQQQQHYRQHNNNTHVTPHHQLFMNRNNLIIQQHQQQHANFNQANPTATSSSAAAVANNQNNQINLQRFVSNHNSNNNNNNNLQINNNRLQIAKTTITATATLTPTAATEASSMSNELIGNQNHNSTNSNINSNKINRNSNQLTLPALQQQQQQNSDTNAINNNNYNYNASVQQQQELYKIQQQQQQQQHKQSTTNDIKIDFQSAQQQQRTTTSTSSHTVQPMCMSPEHQPSTPTHGTSAGLNQSHHPLLAQGGCNTLAVTATTTTTGSSSSPSPATASNLSSSSSSSSCSYPSPLIDDNVVNQKQLLSPANITLTTIKTENLISTNEQQNQQQQQKNSLMSVDNINETGATVAEMSTLDGDSNSQQQQQSTIISSNKKLTEYNNNNSNGCQTLSASTNDTNSNLTITTTVTATATATDQQLVEVRNQKIENNNIDFESMETNNIESTQSTGEHANAHELHDTLGFFNETLDLSQEDIQRTLIANLPFDTTGSTETIEGKDVTNVSGLDFLTNACAGAGGDGNGSHNNNANDAIPVPSSSNCEDDDETDDVFVNLDAFDMLVEFPDLDLDDKQALSHASLEHAAATVVQLSEQVTNQNHNQNGGQHLLSSSSSSSYEANEKQAIGGSTLHCNRKLHNICDFSPEWSYPEGGVKVLVAGPWTSSNATYTVLFDSLPVPTLLVQEGVLRCYCPAHEVGFATLQVSCDGYVVSNSVMFEYKMSPCPEAPFDATSNDCLYKFSLLNRLSTIDEKMQIKTESGTLSEQYSLFLQVNFEEKLVSYCHHLMKGTWRSNTSSWSSGIKGMSLLHLAAALGYSKLVCAMLNWRAENPNYVLETELDALSQDIFGYTPMTWACARGHTETALILYKWNQNALKIKNYAQQSPLDIANLKGHKTLLNEIYRLEYERNKKYNKNSFGTVSLNLNKYELNDKNSTKNEYPSTDECFDDKVSEHIFAGFEATFDARRSHDGVFLRPIAVASNQSPPNNSRFSKRSSVDSGINMDIRGKPGKSLKDLTRLQSFDTHDSYSLSVESPLDNFNMTATSSLLSPMRKMDFALCEVSTGDSSPLPDKDHDDSSTINNDDIADIVINNETEGVVGDSDAKVLTLAEHIIAAMPERIKNEADEMMVLGSPITEPLNSESSGLNDSFMDPLLDSLPNTHFDSDFSLDFNDHSYRYHDVSTPCSSLSPASSGPLQSPASYSLLGVDPSVNSPSPPPSTKQLTEFLHASSCNQYPFEADFSRLTLTDSEQRELYEAAKCIQKAYRSYKGRQKMEEQNKERSAAIVIQNYYRRYKQYAYYRQMTNAALVIQHGYRSYCRHKRFKKSQSSTTSATSLTGCSTSSQNNLSSNSQCLSSFYDHFKNDQQQQELMMNSQPSTPKETSPSGPLKRTYSQSTQNQAARKIQQFMRQSRIKLQRERAEKEKLVHQRRAEYLQSLQFQGQPEIVCNLEQSESNHIKLFNTLHQLEKKQLQQSNPSEF